MKVKALGVDAVDVKRFIPFVRNRRHRFLTNTYSPEELRYCFSFTDTALHLAGTFAAKEAVFKTLGKNAALSSIEVRRSKNGSPAVWMNGRRQKSIMISISHTADIAVACALRQ